MGRTERAALAVMGLLDLIQSKSSRRCALGLAALLAIAAWPLSNDAYAKHSSPGKPQSPCTAPETFIRAQVAKIAALKTARDPAKTGPPATVADFFARWEDKPDTTAADKEIADLRQRAGVFNDMLKAEGCTTIDVDAEVAKAVSSASEAHKSE